MHCQKCRTPLRLDGSLEDLNPAAFKLLVDSSASPVTQKTGRNRHSLPAYQRDLLEEYDGAAQNSRQPAFKRSVPPRQGHGHGTANPAMSFVVLSDSQVVPELGSGSPRRASNKARKPETPSSTAGQEQASLSHQTHMAARLFEILSSRSDIDHPICAECAELLVDGLQRRLTDATKERDAYVEFLRQVNAEIPSEEEAQQAEAELKQALEREKAALSELEKLEAEKASIEQEILALDARAMELNTKEERFWAERNAFSLELAGFQSERDRVNTQYDHDSRQLQRLQRANVYNDTFSIGHDGFFGTINGLRLGRLPDRPVEWAEINAAWGHTCLLLATVAEKLDFRFQGYELRPMGSTSRIIQYIPKKTSGSDQTRDSRHSDRTQIHELYSSGEYVLSIGIFNSKFDNAMVAFLECLRQLIQHAQNTQAKTPEGSTVVCPPIPYAIDKDKIGEVSIKLGGFNQEESWTKACKSTLICCKFLLAHASNVIELGRRG